MKLLFVITLTALLAGVSGSPAFAQHKPVPVNTLAMASHFGHGTPPLYTMKDLAGEPFSLGALKGHWTLLYFWADWCEPCVEKGIPELSDFVRRTPVSERSQFRIVAIRFNSLSESGDWNDFKRKTERLEKSMWHEVPPFPIVYDTTTKVTTSWGIHELPTTALIDPDGNLVRNGSLKELKQVLAAANK